MDEEVIKKYIDIVVEKIGDQISVLAEGHQMLVERFDRQDKRFNEADARAERFETEVRVRFDKMDDRIDSLQSEVRAEFKEVKSMIKLSYAELDRRMTTLERNLNDLAARVERLETNPS